VSAAWLLAAYRGVFSSLIVVATVQTLLPVPARHIVLLATVEIAGALLLLVRRTQWFGASLLLAVFACAQVVAAVEGDYPTRFLQYAASTVLIVMLDRAPLPTRGA